MKYKEFFVVELLHDYFADGRARGLRLLPTAECEQTMRNCGLIWKFYENKLYIISRTLDAIKPSIAPEQGTLFSFWLIADTPEPLSAGHFPISSGEIYYFDNINGQVVDAKKYLHAKPPVFNAANAYNLGDFTRNGADDCFECLVNIGPGTSALNNPAQWRPLGKLLYANATHRTIISGPSFTLPVAPAIQNVNLTVAAYNAVTGLYDIVKLTEVINYPSPVSLQPVNLEKLDHGRYKVTINGIDKFIYLRPQQDWHSYLGLVEILHDDLAITADYRLLQDVTGNFLSTVFSIRMAPASVLFQFVARTNKVTQVYDKTNTIEMEPNGALQFCSKLPQRLSETPNNQFRMEYQSNPMDPPQKLDEEPILEVPGFRHFRKRNKDGTDYTLSESFLSY